MVDIRHESTCAAPVDVVFAFVDDYRNVPGWMFGISSFDPIGSVTQGLGAEYDAAFAVKPVRLSSRVRVTRWAANELIALESTKGFTNSSTWHFAPDGADRTTLRVVFSYELPLGLAGRALGRVFEPVLALSVRRTDESLRRQVEARHAAH